MNKAVVPEHHHTRQNTGKLPIVIICWNDLMVMGDRLESIYRDKPVSDAEVIVGDNDSTSGAMPLIQQQGCAERDRWRGARGNGPRTRADAVANVPCLAT
jgi:hypothetical protein